MRRSLVLVDETARHPFLRYLPPHVRRSIEPIPRAPHWDGWIENARLFLLAYCACFMAVSAFIL